MGNDPNKKLLLSVVIPCYNEEEVIGETIKRLKIFCSELVNLNVELIFVDDGSQDRTRELLKTLISEDSRMRIIGFARNYGHQIALTAGIDAAWGDAVVLIDADLQDPPEIMHEMIAKWREGYDVVYAVRTERPGESAFKIFSANLFYRLLNHLSEVSIPLNAGDFRLISKNVADTIREMPERDRFLRGMVSWVGFKQVAVPYKRAERFAGVSKYPLTKMLRFAKDGILSFSSKPLQLAISFGFLCALIALVGILYVFLLRIFTNTWVIGWTAIMITVLFIGGVQLICIGILGEYIGRIYNQVKQRPLYIVKEYIGYQQQGPFLSRSPVVKTDIIDRI